MAFCNPVCALPGLSLLLYHTPSYALWLLSLLQLGFVQCASSLHCSSCSRACALPASSDTAAYIHACATPLVFHTACLRRYVCQTACLWLQCLWPVTLRDSNQCSLLRPDMFVLSCVSFLAVFLDFCIRDYTSPSHCALPCDLSPSTSSLVRLLFFRWLINFQATITASSCVLLGS